MGADDQRPSVAWRSGAEGGDPEPTRPAWAQARGGAEEVHAWAPRQQTPPTPPPSPRPAPRPPRADEVEVGAEPEPPPPSPEPQRVVLPEGSHVVTDADLEALRDEIADELREPYLAAASALNAAADELEQRLYDDIVDLAVRLAEAVVHRTVALDRDVVIETARRALRLAGPVARVVVRCNADDAAHLRERLVDVAHGEAGRAVEVIVRPSDDIDAGGCLLTFDSGIVDARVSRQLDRLAEAVKAAIHDAPLPKPRTRRAERTRTVTESTR